MNTDPYIGQVLDEKYRLERLLGRGGMGAVYLATHLGTERYVALKLITPQFMRNEEFVARFKREARAAGRLRHPNVVDVTDFGFSAAGAEPVAYLVMEYLDGCTLGDVLSEEKRLPLEWVVDILEQVCSAVHEAHQQGIVHRDLKPENIWLEPNRLGGYRVKVLDFGIAKLAEAEVDDNRQPGAGPTFQFESTGAFQTLGVAETALKSARATSPSAGQSAQRNLETQHANLENDTLVHTAHSPEETSQNFETLSGTEDTTLSGVEATTFSGAEATTKVFERQNVAESTALQQRSIETAEDDDRTLLFGKATQRAHLDQQTRLRTDATGSTELTRVGAIMGTPLYMSPEQCAGQKLDARSDIYSIGVIAYQMLVGEPPFTGTTGNVMQEHLTTAPSSLRERNTKVRKRAAQVVMKALAKKPEDRPQTAAAFASALRAQSEGVGSLYRRAIALYSEHFPKFLKLSFIAHLPVIVITLLMVGLTIAEDAIDSRGLAAKVVFIAALILLGLMQVVGHFLAAAAISGMTAVIVTQLTAAPLRPVELHTAFALLKRRWRPFLKTSLLVTLRIFVGIFLLIIPGILMYIRYALYAPVVLIEGLSGKAARQRARQLASRAWRTVIIIAVLQFLIPMIVSALVGQLSFGITTTDTPKRQATITRNVFQQLSGLFNIFVAPLISIVPALLYLKMRQLGGETLTEALAAIEEVDTKSSEWRRRMRSRLSLHTPRSATPRSR